jgi:hypothetical protein
MRDIILLTCNIKTDANAANINTYDNYNANNNSNNNNNNNNSLDISLTSETKTSSASKEIPWIYETRRFTRNAVFTTAQFSSLPWARLIHSMPYNSIFLIYLIIKK